MVTQGSINNAAPSGITFDGTNVLANYAPGTWTPDVQLGGAKVGITYGLNEGFYVRVGELLFIYATIALSSKGTSVGAVSIQGLPFTVRNQVYYNATRAAAISLAAAGNELYVWAQAGDAFLGMQETSISGGPVGITNADFANTSAFTFQGFYQI